MSPHAVRQNLDYIRQLRKRASDAHYAGQEALRIQIEADADRIAKKTAAAVRASDWPASTRDEYLAELETR